MESFSNLPTLPVSQGSLPVWLYFIISFYASQGFLPVLLVTFLKRIFGLQTISSVFQNCRIWKNWIVHLCIKNFFITFETYSASVTSKWSPNKLVMLQQQRCIETTVTSSHSEVFLGKGVLKICSKFTGEHPCRSMISIKLLWNFIEIAFRHWCSLVNLLDIFRTPFLKNTSVWLLLNSDKKVVKLSSKKYTASFQYKVITKSESKDFHSVNAIKNKTCKFHCLS